VGRGPEKKEGWPSEDDNDWETDYIMTSSMRRERVGQKIGTAKEGEYAVIRATRRLGEEEIEKPSSRGGDQQEVPPQKNQLGKWTKGPVLRLDIWSDRGPEAEKRTGSSYSGH